MHFRTIPLLLALAGTTVLAQTKSPDIQSTLDPKCQPCQDFFGYVNQKWIDANPIPGAYGRWGSFDKLAQDNRERLKTIVESAVADYQAGKDPVMAKAIELLNAQP